ncbi:hypothetical protein ABW20_dc0104390 [Dactylellina cionopaga]|nr:hypothetical protein ABW20_dc0104390 [Dactylellina cionopaga]
MATRRRQTPNITLTPILARVVSGQHGTRTPIREPLLRIIKVQGISMTAGPRENPDDEREPQEGETLFAYRLFLTDDVYVVGAVLDPVLHPLVHDKILTGPGTYIRLTDYDVKTSTKKVATNKFTRFLKVRDLIVEYSPAVQFSPENLDEDGDSTMTGNGTLSTRLGSATPRSQYDYEEMEGEEQQDEVVVIKQETASSQQQADIGLDGNRDREFDEYGLDNDDEEDLFQLENMSRAGSVATRTTTPDSYATADEQSLSPDYLPDDLDDFMEEEMILRSMDAAQPTTATAAEITKKDVFTATWTSSSKERFPEEKLRLPRGMRDILTNDNGGSGSQKKKSNAQPIFQQKENRHIPSTSTSGPSCSKAPAPINNSTGSSRQKFSPLPQQDRGISPGPSKSLRSSQSSMPRSTHAPMTPKRPPQRDAMLPSSPLFTSSPQQSPQPIQITKLGDLFKKPLGTKVDVLAIIERCDENIITRSIGVKRDMHLLDPTVDHTVWLSVWVDAAKFRPAIGSCVLFRGLTVHKFDGRSLNAFKEVAWRRWCVIEPTEEMVAGVDELKEWWRKRAVEEALRSFGDDDDDEDF